MDKKPLNCSKCGGDGPFHSSYKDNSNWRQCTSMCIKCRSEEYYAKRYTTKCKECYSPRKLDSNGECHKCNEGRGVRECKVCKSLLITYLNFYGSRKVCKTCIAKQQILFKK